MAPEVLTGDNNNIGSIEQCETLSSLEQFVQPAYVPGIRKIKIEYCNRLVSLPSFKDLRCLEELKVCKCPNINSTRLLAPSLKKLELDGDCGNLADNIDCSALTYLRISKSHLTSIQLQMWNLPALQE
jgi:Leucine-rich repeat (LRR) protein